MGLWVCTTLYMLQIVSNKKKAFCSARLLYLVYIYIYIYIFNYLGQIQLHYQVWMCFILLKVKNMNLQQGLSVNRKMSLFKNEIKGIKTVALLSTYKTPCFNFCSVVEKS